MTGFIFHGCFDFLFLDTNDLVLRLHRWMMPRTQLLLYQVSFLIQNESWHRLEHGMRWHLENLLLVMMMIVRTVSLDHG